MNRVRIVAAVVSAAVGFAALIVTSPVCADVCATLEVRNVRPGQGVVRVVAYDDPASFDRTPAASAQLPAGAETTMHVQLCGLKGPSVAIKLFQDVNGNGKLDVNALGMPSEPWGASGKPTPMAPPTFTSASVPLDGSTIVVALSR
jgi:uncharacterized protein (DUF2141 family)